MADHLVGRFDVFGRFEIDVLRRGDRWVIARIGQGMRASLDLAIPDELDEAEVIRFLEDLWHESARPGSGSSV